MFDDNGMYGDERWLKGDDDKPKRSDYSILSVAVLTLGLILLVELGRHRLDHAALGRPFFQAVLEGVYRELSTLGLVEFFIWLLLSYWENINVPKEKVFVKVHFTLFYTAVLNAFQTVIVAILTMRASRRIWVKTETCELNHYVEIREEFDRVSGEIQRLSQPAKPAATAFSQRTTSASSESTFDLNWHSVRSAAQNLRISILHPRLRRRYNDLLVQVRFHELRVHLLAAYKLPPQFKVSDYLMRTEQHVLIRLVHVSTVAWLFLTASVNLLYFVLGMVTWETGEPELVGELLTWIFFGGMCVFILFSLVVSNKMGRIFNTIMERSVLWEANDDEETRVRLARQQRALFWASDPTLVISAIQFMQFGYAVFLAVCLIFWETINNGDFAMETYILSIFGCYALFVLVTVQTIPQFTLCTNLGQLVDQRRLQDAVAAFQLEQTKRERQMELEATEYDLGGIVRESKSGEEKTRPVLSKTTSYLRGTLANATGPPGSNTPLTTTSENSNPDEVDPVQLMAELVKLDTSSLRTNLPESERERLSGRDGRRARKEARRRMRKTMSDGVAAMAAMRDDDPRTSKDDSELERHRNFLLGTNSSVSSGTSTEDKLSARDTEAERLALRRSQRKSSRRAESDGVALMARMHTQEQADETPPLIVKTTSEVSLGELSTRTGDSPKESVVRFVEPDDEMPSSPLKSAKPSTMNPRFPTGQDFEGQGSEEEYHGVKLHLADRKAEHKKRFDLHQYLRKYYLSRQYIVLSNVFGTMFAFFLVGQRVERFLHTDQIVNPGEFVSYDFKETTSFWMLTFFFAAFLWNDLLIGVILYPKRFYLSRVEKRSALAAAIDVLIVSVCLTVFFVAEAQRCCQLEDDGVVESAPDDYGLEPAPCDCPPFGSRLYGGLGSIEPYTAIIALRLFRHWVAKRCIVASERMNHTSEEDKQLALAMTTRSPFDVFGDEHGEHGSTEDARGTAAELWKEAIASHPEIAAKYGDFSGELLQAMLGIPVATEEAEKPVEEEPSRRTSFALNEEYADLTPRAQEIIVAGKLGQNVKCVGSRAVSGVPEAIPEDETTASHPTRSLRFEIDASPTEAHELFVAPNARLVHSMRRGHRKLLPLIDKWTEVDIVLTRYEMVYFEATTGLDDVHAAVTATKGGQGLRLCDVAAGRKVVGHVELRELKSIHVERAHHEADFVAPSEFWEGVNTTRRLWSKQDRLVLESSDGQTLYLRFYADATEKDELGAITAFAWARTIGRYCGTDQLKQPLAHFGDDSENELRDYILHEHHGLKRLSLARLATGDMPKPLSLYRRSSSLEGIGNKPAAPRRSLSVGRLSELVGEETTDHGSGSDRKDDDDYFHSML